MKRKLLNSLLLLSLMAGGTSLVFSCKDYDEDAGADIQARIAQGMNVSEALDAQIQALKAQANEIDGKVASLDNKLTENYMLDAVGRELIRQKGEELTALINDEIDAVNAVLAGKADQTALDAVRQSLDDLAAVVDGKADQTALDAVRQSLDDLAAVVDGKADQTALDAVRQSLDDLAAVVDGKADQTALDEVKAGLVQQLNDFSTEVNGKINAINDAIAEMDGEIIEINDKLVGMSDSLKVAYETAAEAKAKADLNEARLNIADERIDSLAAVTNATEEEVAAFKQQTQDAIDALKDKDDAQDALIAGLDTELDALADKVDEIINTTIPQTVADLTAAYEAADEALAADIADVKAIAEEAKDLAEANEKLINQHWESFKNVMAQYITGIIVQGTENPVFGQFATPFGVNNYVLAAYYGEGETQFPTTNDAFYVFPSQRLTAADLQVMGMSAGALESGVFMNEDEGNAGTLYLTINPNEVEFDGTAFSLVNSRGEESKVQLSPVVSSDKLLNFGYTRAASNGFYETKATIAKADIDALKLNVNKTEIETIASDLVQMFNGGSVKLDEISTLLYRQVKDVLPANALKYTWTDTLGTHSNTSQYAVAATAVKPLSYSFMKDAHPSIPHINEAEDLLNDLADKIANPDADDDIHAALDKLNNKFGDLVGNFNKALQPVLLGKTTENYTRLSGNKSIPTVISGGTLTLAPTSYTAELLAPAYKKAVAVSNVYKLSDYSVNAQAGDADCLAKANAANAGEKIATVLAGQDLAQRLTMSGLVSGYVYEIAYTAVDYSGKVVAKKYYVRVN